MMKKHISLLVVFFLAFVTIDSLGQTQTFTTTNATWPIPAGVKVLKVEAWGGGGAGGGIVGATGATRTGGGGAGGAYVLSNSVDVSALTTVAVTVGAGGAGSTGAVGGSGQTSSFGALVTANGGAGGGLGTGASNATDGFGVGSAATTGTNNGGAGAAGSSTYGGGGGGGAGATGPGGNSTTQTGGTAGAGGGGAGATGPTGNGDVDGNAATALSGGGSGARSTNNGTNRAGGNGFRGQVIVTWVLPNTTGLSVSLQGTACDNNGATFAISSSNLITDTYTITYNITGTLNSVTGATATVNFTAGSPGTATFTTSVLNNAENDVLQITRIASSSGNFVDLTNNTNFTVNTCRVWYTYQTGNYNDPNTWTLDPSGTTYDNGSPSFPTTGDEINILNGFTVTMNVNSQNLVATTIQGGGTLDMSTTTGQNLGVITGTGLLRVKGVALPSGTYTDFVTTLGGTVEYYDVGGTLPATQTIYNVLKLTNAGSSSSAITFIEASDLIVNGTFTVGSTGLNTVTWQINDNSASQRTITLNGDLNVNSNGAITVKGGTAAAGTTATPHLITMYGNFTNNGTVRFFDNTASTNLLSDANWSLLTNTSTSDVPGSVYIQTTRGFGSAVTFRGTGNQTVTCNNITYFYNVVVNKGTSTQPILNINSSSVNNFRLYGPANYGSTDGGLGDGTGGPTSTSQNALSIANGTLQLTGSITIPILGVGSSAALTPAVNQLYALPQTAQLWLNGANVSVNVANANTGNTDQRFVLQGILKISNGTFTTGYTKGLVTGAAGALIVEGGTLSTWQIRPAAGTGSLQNFSYVQSGGMVNVGTNAITFTDPNTSTTYTTPAMSGVTGNPNYKYARFAVLTGSFQMSGGTLNVGQPTQPIYSGTYTTATNLGPFAGGIDIESASGNYNVTGGTVNVFIPSGAMTTSVATNTWTPPNNFTIYSTAPLYNLNVYKEGATAPGSIPPMVKLNYNLTVLNNLTLVAGNNPTFDCNGTTYTYPGVNMAGTPSSAVNNNLTVGGNFIINSSTTFIPSSGTGILTFNGSVAQSWTNSGTIGGTSYYQVTSAVASTNFSVTAIPAVVVNKTGILTVTNALGTNGAIGSLTLTSGTMTDNGNAITVTSGLTNNAIHTSTGSGSITYNAVNGTIGGTSGTFGNLILSGDNSVTTMSGNQTIAGNLQLSGATSSILDIGSNSLRVNGSITSTVGLSNNSFIKTVGLHNAGGLTRPAVANTPLLFPVGTGALYTPNTITVNLATTYGTVTVRPVSFEHPNVTTVGTSLVYYWRVTSSGFVTTASTTVSHSAYDFKTSTKNGTPANYQAARYDRSLNQWATNNTPASMSNLILPDPFNTGSNWTWSSGGTMSGTVASNFLDGEYTCGNIGAFGTVTAYYSKTSGSWAAAAAAGVWTNSPTHTGGTNLAGPPCATCPVVIGDTGFAHTITVDANNRSCGTLAINTGSTLDGGRFTGLNFGTTAGGAVAGGGTLRIGSPNFPAGDFTNFIGSNGGTVEWYLAAATGLGLTGQLTPNAPAPALAGMTGPFPKTYNNVSPSSSTGSGTGAKFDVVVGAANTITSVTTTQAGSGYVAGDILTFLGTQFGGSAGTATYTLVAANIAYVIPTRGPSPQNLSLANYYNLIVNPLTFNTISLPASNLTVYNNMTQGTVSPYNGIVLTNGPRTLSIAADLAVNLGTFTFSNSAASATSFIVGGNTTISNGAVMRVATGGTANAHTFSTLGSISNSGTLTFNSTGTVDLTFTGTSNVNFTGTGTPTTTLSKVIVNKGTSQTPTVTFSLPGTINTTATALGWLVLTNGTFDFNSAATTTTLSTNSFTIPSTAKLKAELGTVYITNGSGGTNDLFVNGALEVAGGVVKTTNTALGAGSDNDLEYASAGTPTITVSGGSLTVDGSIRRSIGTLTGALVYNQTNGTVTVKGQASNTSRGVFEIDYNTGSSFTLTGSSTLTVVKQTGGSLFPDIYINPSSAGSVSSTSTIKVGTGTANANFRITIAPTIGNFTIDGITAQTVNMFSNPLRVGGSLTIPTGCTLNANSLDVTIAGDLDCDGTYTGGTNTTTFNGTGPQSGALSSTSTFNDFTINKTAGTTLTLSGTAPQLQNLNILSGILSLGTSPTNLPYLDVRKNMINNSSQIGDGYILIYSTTANSNAITSSGGSFTHLTLGGDALTKAVSVSGNLTINGILNFASSNRYLMIGSGKLTFGTTASTPTGYGSNAFIRTNGVSSDLGVAKTWGTGTSTFVYPIGVSTTYSPVSYSLNVTAGGDLTVIPVNNYHPTYNQSGEQILKYYWTVKRSSSLIASASGMHTYSFPSSLITGSGGTLSAGYLDPTASTLGWVTSGHNGSINTGLTPYRMEFLTTPTTNFPPHDAVNETSYDYSVGTPGLTGTLPNPIQPLYSRLGKPGAGTGSLFTDVDNPAIGGSWIVASNWTSSPDGDLAGTNPSSFAPTGIPVVILPGATINIVGALSNGRRVYKTTINGSGVLNITTTTLHNIGIVSGTGTLRTNTNVLPGGDFTAFTSSAGGTMEFVAPVNMFNRQVYNNISIYSGTPGTVTMTAAALTVNGSVTVPAGTTLDGTGNTGGMAVAGSWTNAGTFTAGAGAISIAGSLTNSGTFTPAATTNVTLTGNLTNTGTFSAGASTNFSLAGNLINSTGTFNHATGTVIFNGSSAQSTTGVVTFNNLTINKTGNLTLGSTANVNGVLTMTSGNIISNTYSYPTPPVPLLVLSSAATNGGSSATSFVSGQIRKTISNGQSFVFPVGSNSASRFRPVKISATTADDAWDVSYIPNSPSTDNYSSLNFNSANMVKVSNYEYWQISNGTGSTKAGLTLSYGPGSYGTSNIGDETKLKTARWAGAPTSGGPWDIPTGIPTFSISAISAVTDPSFSSFVPSDNVKGTVTVTRQDLFSPQTLATDDPNSSLPIELVDFTARLVDSSVKLDWFTASELNNDYFTIERASDLEHFEEVGKVKGKGTSKSRSDYALTDNDPLPGVSYYRLKQTDFDGVFSYSALQKIENSNKGARFRIYPNPLVDDKFNFELIGVEPEMDVPLKVLNLQGNSVFESNYKADQAGAVRASVKLNQISSGLYIVIINADTGLRKKIVIP